MTFAAKLAKQHPGQLAVRDAELELTWDEVDGQLRRMVNGILAAELGEQRRVAVFAENSARTLLCYVAATLAGCSAVPVNYHLTAEEAAYIFEDSAAALVFAGPSTVECGVEAARLAGVPLVVARSETEHPGAMSWHDWLAAASDAEPPTSMEPLPSLVYTSGTTGRPRGTPLPPTSFVGGSDIGEHVRRLGANPWLEFGPHMVVGPMYHSGPLVGTRLFIGGAQVSVLGKFDAETVLATIDRDRIASTVMVPTHFVRLLGLPEQVRQRYDLSSLRYVLQVGSKCASDVKRAMIDWWGEVIWESYGASEVGTTCLIGAKEWLAHPGSVGMPVPPFEVIVLDEHGDEVPAGAEGLLYFKDTTGRGIIYHNAPDKQQSVHLKPGVFTLGEIGYVDDDGYIFITDRFSDMVVSGGVNIYPAEAELVLAKHPDVAEVACVGVPHAEMGEELKAIVVPHDQANTTDPTEILTFCRDHLAHFKCPRSIEFAAALPRTAMGKLDKRQIRAAFAARGLDQRRVGTAD